MPTILLLLLAIYGCVITYATYRRRPLVVNTRFHRSMVKRYGERITIGYTYALGIGMTILCTSVFVWSFWW
jgi:hypothetical protein